MFQELCNIYGRYNNKIWFLSFRSLLLGYTNNYYRGKKKLSFGNEETLKSIHVRKFSKCYSVKKDRG